MILIKKIKAGALQLTMFVIVIIALLLFGFIILIHTQKQFDVQTDIVIQTITNVNKTVSNTLSQVNFESQFIENQDLKYTNVIKESWGLFEKIMITSQIKNKQFQKIALIGGSQPNPDRTALYMQENNKPLVVVGNTKIQGIAYLSKQGIRQGNIAGNSYYGEQLIYGQTKQSGAFPQPILMNNEEDFNIDYLAQEQFIDLNTARSHKNSFRDPLKVIYSDVPINLTNTELSGHIKVISTSKISVDASSKLNDIILIAPIINIKAGTKGCFQAFAQTNLTIGKGSQLDYPSVVMLKEKVVTSDSLSTHQESNAKLQIKANSNIKGIVAFIRDAKPNNFNPQLIVESGTTINGEVYCNQNIELQGDVLGTVYASNFIVNQAGSIYQNHIYNASITVNDLPVEYSGLLFKNSKKSITKWLY